MANQKWSDAKLARAYRRRNLTEKPKPVWGNNLAIVNRISPEMVQRLHMLVLRMQKPEKVIGEFNFGMVEYL